jgi:death-on-curing protein
MKSLDLEQVIRFQQKLINSTGGSLGIRSKDLIDSAINRGLSTFEGKDLYKTDIEKIAAITHSLITNHGFVDGNKRIGIAAMLLLLEFNNINISYTQKELIELGLGLAASTLNFEDIIIWIKKHQV